MNDLIKRLRDAQYEFYLNGDVDMYGLLGNATDFLENVPKWISVKEALPTKYKEIDGEKYYKEVAVRVKNLMHSKIAYYDPETCSWYGTDFFPIRGITHWCELPDWE